MPEITGMPKASQASAMPSIARANCQAIGRLLRVAEVEAVGDGDGKSRRVQDDVAGGLGDRRLAAPIGVEVGSGDRCRRCRAARPAPVCLTRSTAASPPGSTTVFSCTWWSYCSHTQRRLAMLGEPSRSSRISADGRVRRRVRVQVDGLVGSWPGRSCGTTYVGASASAAAGMSPTSSPRVEHPQAPRVGDLAHDGAVQVPADAGLLDRGPVGRGAPRPASAPGSR